ncbi:MAG: energy transducer TonB [Bacteroidota bacterium]
MNIFSDWSDEINSERNELVFADKNKAYGAYQIRKGYGRTMMLSCLVGISAMLLAVGVPTIISSMKKEEKKEKVLSNEQITIDPIEKLKEDLPPPPPPPPPIQEPPKIETTKFVETVIVDEEVKEEVKTQEELIDTKVSTTTQEGNDDIVIPEEKVTVAPVIEDKPEEIFTGAEENAQFPGGDAALMKFVRDHITYPAYEKEADISGKVLVRFVVEKDGQVSNVEILKKVSPGIDKEAIRVIQSMPRWTPAKNNGKPVRLWFNMPINFTLQ